MKPGRLYPGRAIFRRLEFFPDRFAARNGGEARSGLACCARDRRRLVAGRLWSLSREADLSTEQTRSQTPTWVSRAHGNGRRSQSSERPPRARAQAPVGLTAIRAGSARPSPLSRGPHALDETAGRAAAECSSWGRLTRRAEFQRTARGRRAQLEAFALQANRRLESPALVGPRVGFTVTKKIGNAVVRNRIRRRLREALRRISCLEALPDHDYVLMARLPALTMDFEALVGEIDRGFRQLRRDKPRSGPRARDRDRRS